MSSFIFFVVFLRSLASSLAMLLSSLVIMTVFGLNCCPPASPTSAELFIELHSSSIALHLSLLLSPSLYLHLFLCRHRPHLDGSALFFFSSSCSALLGILLILSISLSHFLSPLKSLFAFLFILLLLPTKFWSLLAHFPPHSLYFVNFVL